VNREVLNQVSFFAGSQQDLRVFLSENQGKSVHLASAHTMVSCSRDEDLLSKIKSGVVVADSVYVARITRLFDSKIQNIRGIDFLRDMMLNDGGLRRHIFVVPNHLVASKLRVTLENMYSHVKTVKILVPGYSQNWLDIFEEVEQGISGETCDLIWVAIGSPKQDFICAQLASKHGLNAIGIGAAIRFFTGEVREAPNILQIFGLEWLHRICNEPKRLTKRYLKDLYPFVVLLFFSLTSSIREQYVSK